MADFTRPPLPSAGDEAARQSGMNNADQLAQAADTYGLSGGGDMGFTQGLKARREALGMADQNVQAATTTANNVQGFAGGAGFDNAQAVLQSPRAFGEDPAAALQSRNQMLTGLRGFATAADEKRVNALATKQGEVDSLMKFLSSISSSIQERKQAEERKAQADREYNLSLRQQKAKELETGMKWDDNTGEFRPLQEDDLLQTPDGNDLTPEQKAKANLIGAKALSEVLKQGGGDLLKEASSQDLKNNLASEILRSGGVAEYRKVKPTSDVVLGYIEQLQNGSAKGLDDVPAADRGDVVSYLKSQNINVFDIQREREGKQVSEVINGLKNDFYGADGGRGGGDDLSGKGAAGLGLSGLFIKGKAALKMGREGNYKSTKEAMLASLKQITGDKGVLTESDAKRLGDLMPNAGDNPDYAERQWKKVEEMLQSKYGSPKSGSEQKTAKPGREDVVSKLKKAGASQPEIDEYLAARGY